MKTQCRIEKCTFNEIKEIWSTQLWPLRKSPIESISWMDPLGNFNSEYARQTPYFWSVQNSSSQILAVLSGHSTPGFGFRSRGLWVDPQHRRQGFATKLMKQLILFATDSDHTEVWTLPRISSWPFYESQGFQILKKTEDYEFGPHYFARLPLDPPKLGLPAKL